MTQPKREQLLAALATKHLSGKGGNDEIHPKASYSDRAGI
jgi:hypothetical protein